MKGRREEEEEAVAAAAAAAAGGTRGEPAPVQPSKALLVRVTDPR